MRPRTVVAMAVASCARTGMGGKDFASAEQRRRYRGCPGVLSRYSAESGSRVPVARWYASASSQALLLPPSEKTCINMPPVLRQGMCCRLEMYFTAGWRRCCFRDELRKMKSADEVVMTMMCEEGNMVEYSEAYFKMCRPWAPVHVMSRIKDGAEMSSVGVEGVDGMRSHIVGAMRSKPGIASCCVLVLPIVTV